MKPPSDILDFGDGSMAMPSPLLVRRPRAKVGCLRDFYEITKPRMNFLVVVSTMVGYYMACRGAINLAHLAATLVGTALTAAAASIFNQVIESKYDALMPRTMDRPLPTGRIAPREAIVLAGMLTLAGIGTLALSVNGLTALLGAFTLVSYIGIYTPMKRWSTLNTVAGAVPGALPAVMGWTAAHGSLSPGALALFGIMFFWQMPHFLAIAILYRKDYAAGGFKMLPVVDRGLQVTSRQIILYGLALIPVSLLPVGLQMTGAIYFTAAVLFGAAFLTFGISCAISRRRVDARKLFFASIVYLPLLFAVMMMDKAA